MIRKIVRHLGFINLSSLLFAILEADASRCCGCGMKLDTLVGIHGKNNGVWYILYG